MARAIWVQNFLIRRSAVKFSAKFDQKVRRSDIRPDDQGAVPDQNMKPKSLSISMEKYPSKESSDRHGYQIHLQGREGSSGFCTGFLSVICLIGIIITFPFSIWFCIRMVQEYERVVIFRLGRIIKGGAAGPGLFFIMPCIDQCLTVDLRTVTFDVPSQEILTKDSVTISVDAVIYYHINDPCAAVSNAQDCTYSTKLLAASTLRNVLGTKNLSELLSGREAIAHQMQITLDVATDPWGILIERVEIKDISLPVQLQRSMAAEAEATREAKAKSIAADGEFTASRALKDAADMISSSNGALQLRYLQTLNTIAAEKNSTIIFPIPIELFRSFCKS